MERNTYFKIIDLYKKENNLNRLVYRLIKHEDENLSLEQLVNRISKILYNVNLPKLIEEMFEKADKTALDKCIKFLEADGATINKIQKGNIYFTDKNGKSYFTYCSSSEEYKKVKEEIRKKYYNPVEEALKVVLKAGWIEEYEDTRYYISPYSGRRKIKSQVIRFRAKK